MKWATIAAACLLLGCAEIPKTWTRLDGRAPDGGAQLRLDLAACQGEMQKSNVVTPRDVWNRDSLLVEIFTGCMAGKGYVPGR